MADARVKGQKIDPEERMEVAEKVVSLREEGQLSWAAIADEIGVKSPNTARRLYEDTGRDPHHLLEGKGGRTVEFSEGDWCDIRCIASLPDSPCSCKCGGANHGQGPSHAKSLLSEDGASEEEVAEAVENAERIQAENVERAEEEAARKKAAAEEKAKAEAEAEAEQEGDE